MNSKENQPKVTVVLAAYNTEKYISACLNSIVNQTLQEIEIICIDDGSNDNTLNILKKFVRKDKRIRLIEKSKNDGLSVARNEGLELARGKYIAFVDGDDLMDLDLFNKAYNLAENEKSDLVIWDYVTFWNDSEINSLKQKKSILTDISGNDKKSLLKQPSFTWLKLIKTEIARTLKINFPKGLTKQDIPVHWNLITQIDRISILPEKLIYYRQQPNATSYKIDKRLFDVFTIMDITENFLKSNSIYELYKRIFLTQKLQLMYVVQDTIHFKYKNEAIVKINDRITKEEIKFVNSNNDLSKHINLFFLHLQGSFKAKIQYNIWLLLRYIYRYINKNKDAYSILNRKN